MFYANFNYTYWIITYEVQKQQIHLTLEEFVEINDLPWTSSLYKPDELEASGWFNFDATFLSFLSNINDGIPYPLLPSYVGPNIHLIHYVATDILIPRN